MNYEWLEEFPGGVILCDAYGVILSMNDRAATTFAAEGGKQLIGTNLLECHPEPARSRLQNLLKTRARNVYTIEKGSVRKLIYQSPWYVGGEYRGFVELSLELPQEIPHFIRKSGPRS